MAEFIMDFITLIISYILFWFIILILILYPKLRLRKIKRRIYNLQKTNKSV